MQILTYSSPLHERALSVQGAIFADDGKKQTSNVCSRVEDDEMFWSTARHVILLANFVSYEVLL